MGSNTNAISVTHAQQLERFGELYRDRRGVWREAATKREVRVWQRFLSGRRLNLLNPTPFDFESEDLALGLARVVPCLLGEHGDERIERAVERVDPCQHTLRHIHR